MPTPQVVSDVVVVLPGIMGSTLQKDGTLVWAPSAGAVLRAIVTFGRSLKRLVLPSGIGDADPRDGVEPVELMPDLHILPGVWSDNIGYGVLLDWLRSRFHLIEPRPGNPAIIPNLLAVPYDWRLSNRYNGRRLKEIVEPALERWRSQGGPFGDAKLIFICHSMGGLVARWYIEKEGGAEITRKLVTLGTPYRGALKALDQLVNGVRKGIGPLKLDLTAFARSLPSLYQLLPEYACVKAPGGLLQKTTETTLPELDTAMVADAMRFHDELDEAAASRPASGYDVHPIVGTRQKTSTTARVTRSEIEPIETIDGNDEGGDATVPRLSAIPKQTRPDDPIIHWVADQHGGLQSNRAVLDEVDGILSARPVIYKAAAGIELGVRTEPLVLAREKVTIEATVVGEARVALQGQVTDEGGKRLCATPFQMSGNVHTATLAALQPGAYRVTVGGVGATAARVAPVTCTILVWENEGA